MAGSLKWTLPFPFILRPWSSSLAHEKAIQEYRKRAGGSSFLTPIVGNTEVLFLVFSCCLLNYECTFIYSYMLQKCKYITMVPLKNFPTPPSSLPISFPTGKHVFIRISIWLWIINTGANIKNYEKVESPTHFPLHQSRWSLPLALFVLLERTQGCITFSKEHFPSKFAL